MVLANFRNAVSDPDKGLFKGSLEELTEFASNYEAVSRLLSREGTEKKPQDLEPEHLGTLARGLIRKMRHLFTRRSSAFGLLIALSVALLVCHPKH